MGRPEKPLPATDRTALWNLARWLRTHRRIAGLTYAEMAQQAGYHPTTLQRAASGTRVPRQRVVEAYARACRANLGMARRLWRMARHEAAVHRGDAASESYSLSRIALIRDMADLVPAMIDLYHRAGAPSLHDFERRAGAHGQLPHSTIHRILHRKAVPTRRQFAAWIDVCGVTGTERMAWVHAYGRAQETLLRKRRGNAEAWNVVTFTTGGPTPDPGQVRPDALAS